MDSEIVKAHAGTGKEVGESSSCNANEAAITEEECQASAPMDMIIDIETDDLIFSDDAFPSLPDFTCLSSPSASPSPSLATSTQPKAPCLSTKSSTSSSSSSSSSPWSFLEVPTTSEVMQPPLVCELGPLVPSIEPVVAFPDQESTYGLDILGAIDLWDPTDPSSSSLDSLTFLPDENSGGGASQQVPGEEMALLKGGECPSEDLAKVFLEWLKNNKDSISPEDLRSIKLKRSTIECAARRLGGGKQGRVQLLKLILAWVQNHYLQKRRRRSRGVARGHSTDQDLSTVSAAAAPESFYVYDINLPLSPDANPNTGMNLNYEAGPCNSWITYGVEPSLPSLIPGYGGDAVAAPPYHYYHGQPFSPLTAPEILAAEQVSAAWHQGFSSTSSTVNYPSFGPTPTSPNLHSMPPISVVPPYHAGLSAHFACNQPLYSTGMGIGSGTSATKEARKNRMARQRRNSSTHSLRNQQNNHQQQSLNTMATASNHSSMEVTARGSTSPAPSHANNSRKWGFWSSFPSASSLQALPPSDFLPQKLQLPLPPSVTPPTAQMQQHASLVEKRQGFKSEKNLRFLLQKVLKQSDVGSLGRIVLPKKEAEIHLPELDARDGISIEMEDIGTSRVWNMRYRFWPNNKSRMYLLENTGDFVRSNGLQEGDFIVIYSDVKCDKYMIRGVKVRQPVDVKGRSNMNIGKAHQKEKSSSPNCKGKKTEASL